MPRLFLARRCRHAASAFLLAAGLLTGPAAAQQTFENVTGAAGLDGLDGLGHAVGWCDTDGDGDQDLAFSNQDGSGFWFFRNDGDGTFTDRTAAAGLAGAWADRIFWAELTGDTHPDLLLSAGGTRLYRNDGDGTFTDITGSAGLAGTPRAVADVDGDGLCDVIADTGDDLVWRPGLGGGDFAAARQVGPVGSTWTTVAFDVERDGDPDLYVGTYGNEPNRLFRNDGDGTFTEVATQAGVAFLPASHGLTVGDYDNDGWLDLYVGGYSAQRCRLYRNQGDGTFVDVTTAAGVLGYPDTRTVSFTDFDNDGHLDIFASHHDFYSYSNVMWHNQGDGTFVDVGVELGLSGEWVGDYFGVGWADFDGDAAVDLFAAGHIDRYRLFRNTDCPGQALLVDLVGTTSNRSALGAVATAHAGDRSWTRTVAGSSGRRDGSSLALHFGLGDRAQVDSVVVHWPGGEAETFGGPFPAGQRVTLTQGATPTAASPPAPGALTLAAAPNPFNPRVTVSYAAAGGGPVRLEVYDLRGRHLRTLAASGAPTGQRVWDGRDGTGRAVPSGVYELRLQAGTRTASRRVTLVR
jgi:hypothetical protein